jgi:hypothetical protein
MAFQILSPRCTFSGEEEDEEEEKEERAGVVSAWKFGEMYPLSSSSFLCVGFGFLHYYTQVFVLATILANLATTTTTSTSIQEIFSPHFFFIVTLSSHLYLLLYEDQKSHHSKVSVPSACLYYSFLQTWIIKSIKLQQSLLNICFLVFCCFLLTAHIVVITVMVMLLLCKICKNLVISTFFVCHLSLSLFIF